MFGMPLLIQQASYLKDIRSSGNQDGTAPDKRMPSISSRISVSLPIKWNRPLRKLCVLCYKYYHEPIALLAYIFIWYLLSTTMRLTFLNQKLSSMINIY